MKKILLFAFAATFYLVGSAQLLVENFNYNTVISTADSLDNAAFKAANAHAWYFHSGTAYSPLFVNTGIAYAGYNSGTSGNNTGALSLTHGGGSRKDINTRMSSAVTTGSVYCSFLLNVKQADNTTADYFLHFAPDTGTSISNLFGRVFIKKGSATGKFVLGISKLSTPTSTTTPKPVFTTSEYDTGTAIAVVVKYTYTAGASNDKIDLFAFNTPGTNFTTTEPISSTISAADTSATDATTIRAICLRQGTAGASGTTTNVKYLIDGIKVSNNWGDVWSSKQLEYFNTVAVNNQVNVQWQINNEQNISNYTVEKSTNGNYFTTVETYSSKALLGKSNYAFVDKTAGSNGNVYYRLKITYNNGSVVYSNINKVNLTASIKLQISPNPAKNNITINATTNIKKVELFSIKGNSVLKVLPNAISSYINISQLPVGTYVVKTETAEGLSTNTIIKQ